jgi:acetylornithine deacetylase/succinyl-diaminopimelate desuccinylase-like protein
VVIAKSPKQDPKKPTFLVYGHYDVQPADPLELWTSPPFEPRRVGPQCVCPRHQRQQRPAPRPHQRRRGLAENRQRTALQREFPHRGRGGGRLEGFYDFLPKNAKELACKALVVSDTEIPSMKHPALCYSLRGMAPMEIRLDGPDRDLHSGLYGGAVDNPAMVLCQMLASIRDKKGRSPFPDTTTTW